MWQNLNTKLLIICNFLLISCLCLPEMRASIGLHCRRLVYWRRQHNTAWRSTEEPCQCRSLRHLLLVTVSLN